MLKKTNLTKIYTFLVVIMPIANCYTSQIFSRIGMGEFLILLFSPILVYYMMKGINVVYKPLFFFYIVYAIFISAIGWLICLDSSVESNTATRMLRDGCYLFIALLLSSKYFDFKLGKKLYMNFAAFTCIYIYIQTAVYYMSGKILPWVISSLHLNSGYASNESYFNTFYAMYKNMYRPNSIFLEPAQFAHYVFIYLIFVLFDEDKKENYMKAVFITIAMCLSTSGNAIAIAGIIWLVKLFTLLKKNISRRNIQYLLLLFTLGMVAVFILDARFGVFSYAIGQLMTLGNGMDSSANVRLLSGYTFYGELPLWAKIFGIGFGNYMSFRAKYNIDVAYLSQIEYNNSVSYILISVGVMGLGIFFYAMFSLYRKSSKNIKIVLFATLIIGLAGVIYSTPTFVIVMAFVLADQRRKEKSSFE